MENKNNELTAKGFIKTISIIHLALMSGLLLFGTYVYLQNNEWELILSNSNDIFFFIVPVLAISGILLGNYLYKKQIDTLSNNNSLKGKLVGFQTASLIKYALIEGPAFLGIRVSMNNGNLLYLIISTGLIAYFFTQRPTREKIERDLNLNRELKDEFRKME